MYDKLQAVLDDAHAGHAYVSDEEKHGLREHWELGLEGDCEDFALWCRRELRDRYGIESDLVFCRTETGTGHLVVSVDSWILDNRHRWVKRRDDLPYEWIKLGKPNGTWYEIAP